MALKKLNARGEIARQCNVSQDAHVWNTQKVQPSLALGFPQIAIGVDNSMAWWDTKPGSPGGSITVTVSKRYTNEKNSSYPSKEWAAETDQRDPTSGASQIRPF